jgi:phage terminase large subunit
VAVADVQRAQAYTWDGWWRDLERLRVVHGVQRWFADPNRDEMIQAARKVSGRIGSVTAASKKDKPGRLVLVGSLLHAAENGLPAFYVASSCEHLARQFARYRWKTDSHGNPRDIPVDYDDHCIDCTAFLVGEIMAGGHVVPSLVF